jgi:RecA-family ATPase
VGIGLLQTLVLNDPNELLKHLYLCFGRGMLLVGLVDVGKSTLQMQASLCWGIGREFFGIHPARPLKSQR